MSGTWLDQLQPASWRGVPFCVNASEYPRGRRFAVHEYPKRDLPWAEDMGRAVRRYGFSGFVVGDDCYQQAQALLEACEQEGPGELVHPSLGPVTVALVEPIIPTERKEIGRVVEIRFEFIETGVPIFPGDEASTQDHVNDQAAAADTASSSDFVASVGEHSSTAAAANYTDGNGVTTAVPAPAAAAPVYQSNIGSQVVGSWGSMASQQAADPGLAAGAASSVAPAPGTTLGRFDGIGSLGFTTGSPDQAIEDQVEQRNEVDDAADRAARAALVS